MNLVLGANGFIGRHLYHLLAARGEKVLGTYYPRGASTDRRELLFLDVRQPSAAFWSKIPPLERVFICIQHGSLDDCRRQPAATTAVNVRGVQRALENIQQLGGAPIFLSTNLVFSGGKTTYSERSQPNPRTEYGRQKYAVEQDIRRRFRRFCMARLTKVFSLLQPDSYLFHDWLRDLRRGDSLSAAADIMISPLWVADAARSLALLDPRHKPGIYHFAGPDSGSPAHFGRRLAQYFALPPSLVQPHPAKSFRWLETRPRYNLLDDSATRQKLRLYPATIETAFDHELSLAVGRHAMLAL